MKNKADKILQATGEKLNQAEKYELIKLLEENRTSKEICDFLDISHRTYKNAINEILNSKS